MVVVVVVVVEVVIREVKVSRRRRRRRGEGQVVQGEARTHTPSGHVNWRSCLMYLRGNS